MGLQGYVGSAEDQSRIRRLEKEREEERQRLETAKKEATSQPAGFRNWRQGTVEKAETAFRQETIGLISREDYIQKKESVKQRLAVRSGNLCTYHFLEARSTALINCRPSLMPRNASSTSKNTASRQQRGLPKSSRENRRNCPS